MNLAAIVMAAGLGTRMKSRLAKVLHPLLDKPLLSYSLEAVQALQPVQTVVVVGYQAEQITAQFRAKGIAQPFSFALQSPQLGTGHAVQQAQSLLGDDIDIILVVPADLPLLTPQTFRKLVEAHQRGDTPLVMLTVEAEDPRGFGRIVRNDRGNVVAIVEEAACTPEQKAIRELNVGAYAFSAPWLWENLAKVPFSAKGEYYLTDLVDIAVKQTQLVCAEILEDPTEAVGINTRVHLAEAERASRLRVNRQWQEAGVPIIDPLTTYIGTDASLGQDTVIYPNTYLYGKTNVGHDCVIGPNCFVIDSQIGNECEIRFSVVEKAVLEDQVDAGPFAHLRQGAHLAKGVHMGNFGEVKNSYLGPGTKMGHFSYLGDATLGANVNIGAGTITCNYDGTNKHPTKIGDNTFIGSDTMLVAPLNIGKNAKTGAGAVVTRDLPDDSLAYGVPARTKDTKGTEAEGQTNFPPNRF